MHIVARRSVLPDGLDARATVLLLEGDWAEPADHRQSLDAYVDARHDWIDNAAATLADRLVQFSRKGAEPRASTSPIYLYAVKLRYLLVKLLRVIAYFDELPAGERGERWTAHLLAGRDAPYAELLALIARQRGAKLAIAWCDAPPPAVGDAAPARPWRRWAARANHWTRPAPGTALADGERVVICGNSRHLDPVCEEALRRGARAWWLYERFAARTWWRWRPLGVGQLVCDDAVAEPSAAQPMAPVPPLVFRGVDLGPAVVRWLDWLAADGVELQPGWIASLERHFSQVRPTHLVLDQDGTPFNRAAVAIARRLGIPSLVVQHGAPYIRFGYAPLEADVACVWGETSRQKLLEWGVPDQRIVVTGAPALDATLQSYRRRNLAADTAPPTLPLPVAAVVAEPHFLLLTTLAPSDDRPDAVAYHHTRTTHANLLRMVFSVLDAFPQARLKVKLHPRDTDDGLLRQLVAEYPRLATRVCRSGEVEGCLHDVHCVLSCASSAGIEATIAGRPVIQLLPAGSGELLAAEDWGLLGTARTAGELASLVERALRLPLGVALPLRRSVFFNVEIPAAERVVDVLCTRHAATATSGDVRYAA